MINYIFIQISNFFFLLSAFFSDILLIRACLVIAYFLLLLNAALGWPMFPSVDNRPNVAVDSLTWACLNVFFHVWAVVKLLIDEKQRKRFSNDDVEALWSFFRRKAGISRVAFIPILEKGFFLKLEKENQKIDCENYLYLIIDGFVECSIKWNCNEEEEEEEENKEKKYYKHKILLKSGEMFDLRLGNLLGVEIGFLNEEFIATNKTKCLLFGWSIENLESFQHSITVVNTAWKHILLSAVAEVANKPWKTRVENLDDLKLTRNPSFDYFVLDPDKKTYSLYAFLQWIVHSISPLLPTGLRHSAVPIIQPDIGKNIKKRASTSTNNKIILV